jgi:hypothetical protein
MAEILGGVGIMGTIISTEDETNERRVPGVIEAMIHLLDNPDDPVVTLVRPGRGEAVCPQPRTSGFD